MKTLVFSQDTTVHELNEYITTGQTESKTKEKTIQQTTIIDAAKIRSRAAISLGDALQMENNFRLNTDAFLGSSLNINGLGGQNIKILIDGVPMAGRENGNIDLNMLNMENVERIEIIKGPQAVNFGTDAMGGVINIITKKIEKKLSVNENNYIESAGKYNFNSRIGMNKKNISLYLSQQRNFFSGYPNADSERVRIWKPKTQYIFEEGITYSYGKQKKNYIKEYIQYTNEFLTSKGQPVITPYEAYAFDQYFHTSRFISSLAFEHIFSSQKKINIIAAFNNYTRIQNTYYKDLQTLEKLLTTGVGDQDTNRIYSLMSRGTYYIKKAKYNIQNGYDLNYENATGRKFLNEKKYMYDAAIFSSTEYNFDSKFSACLGARALYNNRFGEKILPSLNIKYNIKNITIRSSVSEGFRSPSLKELYLFFVDVNHNVRGNENLKAENGLNILSSVEWKKLYKKNLFHIEISGFYNAMQNMITLVLVNVDSNLYTYKNFERFNTTGGNFSFDFKTKKIFFSAGTGIIYLQNLSNGIDKKWFYNYDAKTILNISPIKKPLNINLFYKYNGPYKYYALSSDGKTGTLSNTEAFHWFDANISYTFFKKKLYIAAGCKNIFDVKNIVSTGGSDPHASQAGMSAGYGRTWFLNLRLSN